MSASLVEAEIEAFLAPPEPEVLCLRGKWGVGKSYAWDAILRRARDKDAIALQSYAYVSLFGRDSLAQLKYAIFENGMPLQEIGTVPTVETFKSNTDALFKRLGQQGVALLQGLPQVGEYASELQAISFLSVRDRLICIDDLERMGGGLAMKDVLGLVSDLRDQKGCKIVLILNEDALEGSDKVEFALYHEKVIDRSVEFAPAAAESVEVAVVGDDPAAQELRASLIALGIANIRIIKKIERLVRHVVPLLARFNASLTREAVRSLTLLGWSVNAKEAPPLDFLRDQRARHVFGLGDGAVVSEQARGWNALLDGAGFGALDEFDLTLLDGIQRGYFDTARLVAQAGKRAEMIREAQAENSFDAAWRLYADSFDDNEDRVVQKLLAAVRRNAAFVSPLNLNAAVRLLKDLGHADEAADALRHYIAQRRDGRAFFDLSAYPFAADITDADVRAAFDARYRGFADNRAAVDVLMAIARDRACNHGDVAFLAKLSVEDFLALFKARKTVDRARIIHAAIQLDRMAGAGDEGKAIAARARNALKRIGAESPLNRRRVLQILDRGTMEG